MVQARQPNEKARDINVRGLSGRGGGEETRTPDPLHAKQVLYQLSYTPTTGRRRILTAGKGPCQKPLVAAGRVGLSPSNVVAR